MVYGCIWMYMVNDFLKNLIILYSNADKITDRRWMNAARAQ